jgi:hypothetical protein
LLTSDSTALKLRVLLQSKSLKRLGRASVAALRTCWASLNCCKYLR